MEKIYSEGLSIVIPSYNRKKELIRLLESIHLEDLTCLKEIVVVDNCSDYDLNEVLKPFSFEKVRIVKNAFNVQMGTNMMNTFLNCTTEWMWIISDDDVISHGAIKTIYQKIEENASAGLLKFSTEGISRVGLEKNVKINSLEELIDYYNEDEKLRTGNLIFLSNGVYNLNVLYPFLAKGFEYSYTFIPFLIPVFFALQSGVQVCFRQEKIVKYNHPENDWSMSKIGMGLSVFSHIPLDLSDLYCKKLLRLIMIVNFFPLFIFLVKKAPSGSKKIYDLVYQNCYKYYLNPLEKLKYNVCLFLLNFPKVMGRVYKLSRK